MNKEAMRKQMEDIRSELNRLDEQRAALELWLKGYEAWLRVYPANGVQSHRQLALAVPGRGGAPKGTISFRKGLIEVLQQARGASLRDEEIWVRMQARGVQSDAKNPLGFVNLTASHVEDAERVAAKTWRWKGTNGATNPQSGGEH